MKSGELFNADSLHFPDSLKYQTNLQKRTVYGGGGIFPDVFVPLDTSQNSHYFSELLRTGVSNDWALEYCNKNRTEMLARYSDVTQFYKNFKLPESWTTEIIALLTDKKVEYNATQFEHSRKAIEIRLRALIARNIFENEAFYYVINDLNPVLKRAIEVLQDGSFEKMKLAHKDFK